MEFQTKIILLSLAVSVVLSLIAIPILRKLKSRANRAKGRTTVTFKKTRNSNYGWNCNGTYATNCWHIYVY